MSYVLIEEKINSYYEAVWNAQNIPHMKLIKIFFYTVVRVEKLVKIKMEDIFLNKWQIHIKNEEGYKDWALSFSKTFREMLTVHVKNNKIK